jgi:hypothetical protein
MFSLIGFCTRRKFPINQIYLRQWIFEKERNGIFTRLRCR